MYHLLLTLTIAFFTILNLFCLLHVHNLFLGDLSLVHPGSFLTHVFCSQSQISMCLALNLKSCICNFAHLGDGAFIIPEITSPSLWSDNNDWMMKGVNVRWTPLRSISYEVLRVGDCWEFAQNSSIVSFLLAEPVLIGSIHLNSADPGSVSQNSASKAPQSLRLWGRIDADVKLPPEATMHTAVEFVPNQLVTSSKSPPHTAT
jgi:hypothetical protein